MGVKVVEYFHIKCDGPGCNETVPDKDADIAGWDHIDIVKDEALATGWRRDNNKVGLEKWFCPSCKGS